MQRPLRDPHRRRRRLARPSRCGGLRLGRPEHPAEPVPPGEHPADRRLHRGPGATEPSRALALSTLFAVGILVTIALIGVVTAAAGRLAGDIGSIGNVAGRGDLHPRRPAPAGRDPAGPAGARSASGCSAGRLRGPAARPGLRHRARALHLRLHGADARRDLQGRDDEAAYGAALLLAYGVGHCLVIAIAGAGSAWVQRTLDWNAESRTGAIIKKACGALVVLGGMYLLYTAH